MFWQQPLCKIKQSPQHRNIRNGQATVRLFCCLFNPWLRQFLLHMSLYRSRQACVKIDSNESEQTKNGDCKEKRLR